MVAVAGCGRTMAIPDGVASGTDSTGGPTSTSTDPSPPRPPTPPTGTSPTGECGDGCPPEHVCVDGVCEPEPCVQDPDCCGDPCCLVSEDDGAIAFHCRPEPECGTDADCPDGAYCVDANVCSYLPELAACAGFNRTEPLFTIDHVALVGLDVNRDAAHDLAAARVDDSVDIRIGQELNPISSFVVGAPIRDLVAGDFDGNGTDDLAMATSTSMVQVLLGNGGGGFRASSTLFLPLPADDLAVADFNLDGTDDLVAAFEEAGTMNVFLLAAGSVSDAWTGFGEGPVYAVAAGDVEGGPQPDLLFTGELGGPGIWVSGPTGLSELEVWSDGIIPGRRLIQAPDLGGDGTVDPVTIHEVNGWTLVALFVEGAAYPATFGLPGRFGSDAEILDANGDGGDDLVVGGDDGLAVLFGETRQSAFRCVAVRPGGPAPRVAGTDVDGDGSEDVVHTAPGRLNIVFAN